MFWIQLLAFFGADVPPRPSPDFATGVQAPLLPPPRPPHVGLNEALVLMPVPREGAMLPAAGGVESQLPDGDAAALPNPDDWPGIPDRLVDHLALDWGVARISGPTMFPPSGAAAGGGRGSAPNGGGGANQRSPLAAAAVPDPAPPILPPIERPEPVPEPGSLALWGTVAAVAAWRRRTAAG